MTVIINRKLIFLIPIILILSNLILINMFEIRKEIVNAIGNVQHSEHIGFVDCSKDDVINRLAKTYYNLARANTLYYKVRGQSYTVRYVFKYTAVADVNTVIKLANAEIKLNVANANEYIDAANLVYKQSNKRRGIKDKSLTMKKYKVEDYYWNNEKHVMEDGYCLLIE